MTLQGDLSTLDLPGLLQNLEAAEKEGLLSIKGERGDSSLYFRAGRLSLYSYPGRAPLADMLQAARVVGKEDMEAAKKRKRRSKKTLGEILVSTGTMTEESLKQFAESRVIDEVCELISTGGGAFQFTEGEPPAGIFDADEVALRLSFPAGPLLLESARRSDHWSLIRDRVPSDAVHYVVQHPPREPEDPAARELQAGVLELLDGTHSVAEVAAAFPHRRFDVYQLIADLSDTQAIRVAAPGDMNRLVREIARTEPERAWSMLQRGLLAHPRNPNLLMTKVLIAQDTGQIEAAAEALKMLVHQHLQAGEADLARKGIERLKGLDADDPFVWERSFAMAKEDKRKGDAVRDGQRLVELYRGPGLFRKACEVLEQLVELEPGAFELHKELARNRADAGDRAAAVQGLEKCASQHLAREDYTPARQYCEEILAIDPDNATARETVDSIKSGELAQRIAHKKRVRRGVLAVVTAILGVAWIWYEGAARHAYVKATHAVSREGLIEAQRYRRAIDIYEEVRAGYGFSTTVLYDVRRQVDELKRKLSQKLGIDEELEN